MVVVFWSVVDVVDASVVVVVSSSVVVVTCSVVVVVSTVVVVVSVSKQLLIVRTFLLSIQWIPPSQGRFSDPLPVQVFLSVNAAVGFVSGVS